MSSRSRTARAKFALGSPPHGSEVDEYVPDYGRQRENCGQSPTVTGLKDGRVVYVGALCGGCTWGEAALIDPKNW